MSTTIQPAQVRTATSKPTFLSTSRSPIWQCTYRDAIGALPLTCRLVTSLGRRRRRYIVPLLFLYTHSNPLILVVEILVPIIYPSPNLLLHIAGHQVRSTEIAISRKRRIKEARGMCGEQLPSKRVRVTRGGLQKALGKHQVWRNENIVEEVKPYCS